MTLPRSDPSPWRPKLRLTLIPILVVTGRFLAVGYPVAAPFIVQLLPALLLAVGALVGSGVAVIVLFLGHARYAAIEAGIAVVMAGATILALLGLVPLGEDGC